MDCWIDVLNKFDELLENLCNFNIQGREKQKVLSILRATCLILHIPQENHSNAIYNSYDVIIFKFFIFLQNYLFSGKFIKKIIEIGDFIKIR